MFIMSLAIADLIVGIIVMPISSFDFIADSGQGNFTEIELSSLWGLKVKLDASLCTVYTLKGIRACW